MYAACHQWQWSNNHLWHQWGNIVPTLIYLADKSEQRQPGVHSALRDDILVFSSSGKWTWSWQDWKYCWLHISILRIIAPLKKITIWKMGPLISSDYGYMITSQLLRRKLKNDQLQNFGGILPYLWITNYSVLDLRSSFFFFKLQHWGLIIIDFLPTAIATSRLKWADNICKPVLSAQFSCSHSSLARSISSHCALALILPCKGP